MDDIKRVLGKIFKGCGCLSIGFFILIVVVAIFSDDDEKTDVTDENKDKTEQVEKKDSVIVNEPLETDPYEELDGLIGLDAVKQEVRSLANFVKLQKQREAKGLKTAKVSYHLVFYGSPGTGKTQTILNIMANLLLAGKTMQIVSNNNSAVENVKEKLQTAGLDFICAQLGRASNKVAFVESQTGAYPDMSSWKLEDASRVRREAIRLSQELQELYERWELLSEQTEQS